MTPSPASLRELAAEIADRGAAVLVASQSARREGRLGVSTKTSETDPVSAADQAAERALVEAIVQRRPDDAILGEEGADRAGTTGLRWVIDPLDGTVNYLYGHTGWSVSVAVERRVDAAVERRVDAAVERRVDGEWVAVAGAVVEPETGHRYLASRGDGATRDGTTLRVNDPVELSMALVGTGFSYDRAHRRRQAAVAATLLGQVRDIRRVGSAALDLCRVASGEVDAYYEDSTRRWDWAAGALIAEEAGAVVTPLLTMPGHSGVVAAGPALHPRVAALVDPAGMR